MADDLEAQLPVPDAEEENDEEEADEPADDDPNEDGVESDKEAEEGEEGDEKEEDEDEDGELPENSDETGSRPATAAQDEAVSEDVPESGDALSRQASSRSRKSVTWSKDGDKELLIVEDDDTEFAKESKQNCCVAIIAGMWASREMLKDNTDKQLFVKVTLRELFVYCIFMFIICYATFTPYSPYNYQLANQIGGIFPTTLSTTNMDQFWTNFVGDVTGPGGVYWEEWYNRGMPQNAYINCPDGTLATGPCETKLTDRGILFENRLLGLPRLRQLKVTNSSCSIASDFQNAIKVCFAPYQSSYEDTEPYIPSFREYTSIDAWTYKTEAELGGTSFTGAIGTYSGGGYTQNLHQDLNVTIAILNELQAGKWITQGTRFITFDFTVYNANINLFCLGKVYFEFPATGGVLPVMEFTSVKLLKYTTFSDYGLMSCEIMFCLYILYYIVEETLEIKTHGISYFFNFWNILDIGVIGISLAQIGLNLYIQFVIDGVLQALIEKPFEFADFAGLARVSRALTQISAFNVFVAWIKLFKYLSFNKTMTQLSGTLSAAAKDLGGFSVMFFIIYFAFVQFGYLLFGVQCYDFRTFISSVFTLFRMILGDFNFKAIEQANTFLGPVYFLSYIFFVFFVLLNMFLAIINDTYGEVKAEVNAAKADFQMSDFFKTGSNNIKSYMGIHDRAVDVENAVKLSAADDGYVTFSELRENLRRARFSDIEIDIFFYYFKNDPQMSSMMIDDEEIESKQAYKTSQDLGRPSIDNGESRRRKSRAQSLLEQRRKSSLPETIPENENEDEEVEEGARPLSGKRARQLRSAEMRNSVKSETRVASEEFYGLVSRVDKMESSIVPLGHKIDFMLSRLDSVYKERKIKKDDLEKIFEGIVNGDDM